MKTLRHLELFSGIGGFRAAIEALAHDDCFNAECVGYSEIDDKARQTYQLMFSPKESERNIGDIVKFTDNIDNIINLPDFDLLTGGFPCQAFSMMGCQKGFNDERGNLIFYIIKILKNKQPKMFLLENVKNLVKHNGGKTFSIITKKLRECGYEVEYVTLNSANFDLAQTRNRVYICGIRSDINANLKLDAEHINNTFKEKCTKKSLWCQKTVLDVLEKTVPQKYYLSEKIKPTILSNGSGGFVSKSEIDKLIARPLTATMVKMHRACQDNYYSEKFIETQGTWLSSSMDKSELAKLPIRKLTPKEAFYLQGFPKKLVDKLMEKHLIADGQLYKQAGNAVSVNTVYAVLNYMFVKVGKEMF